ncbi:acyltransferase family protein [Vibrio breoganii]
MLVYRKEVDGLRTIAVLAVIFYHANMTVAGLPLFKGGFFGVDVFFVLSGYLITGIVRSQMESGTFTFWRFYWSRTKRIVPALLIMLGVSSTVAYSILTPVELVAFAESMKSVLYFGSNYHFLNEDSYTALASIYKPLLHTWTLAVEWQFYIVFPIIVWFVNRFFYRYLFGVLLAATLLSLQYADFIVSNNPDQAFYLLPSRAWELFLGGLITFYRREDVAEEHTATIKASIYTALPMVGLFLVLHSMVFIDHKVAHPSFITLVPVLGTCLFLMFAHRGELATDFLSTKPMVFVGLLSYSMYLWHQPVFVFFRILKYDNFRYEQLAFLLFITFLLSLITYKLVEGRDSRNRLGRKSLALFLGLLTCLVFFSFKTIENKGYPERFGELSYLYRIVSGNTLNVVNGVSCYPAPFGRHCDSQVEDSRRTLLVVGDSNAGALGYSLSKFAQNNNWRYAQLTSSGCSTLPGIHRYVYRNAIKQGKKPKQSLLRDDEWCNANGDALFDFVGKYENVTLIYHTHKYRYGGKGNPKATKQLQELSTLVDELVLIYPIPVGSDHLQRDLTKLKSKQAVFNALEDEDYRSNPYASATSGKHGAYNTLDGVDAPNVKRFYPESKLCNKHKCYTHDDKYIYYYDRHHLSVYGADVVLDDVLKELLE